ncbi:hypothetical protein BDV96DRAFT_604083 [Lophiotrema nucula]|uniref:RING-type domain-containing protein n=1 Tax=Lophiotrema nucula TaxID=690887 RepID=A0A6A5YTQ8_9PLEO|nr:hypothetical protein BDV96DRAFT_604083 [Lophiotrema nucula]
MTSASNTNTSHRPSRNATAFLRLHTTYPPISSLSPEDQTCPICHFSYEICNKAAERIGALPEHPIQITLPTCNHIFGHVCLSVLCSMSVPWGNRCPVCRTKWFRPQRSTVIRAALERRRKEVEDMEENLGVLEESIGSMELLGAGRAGDDRGLARAAREQVEGMRAYVEEARVVLELATRDQEDEE